MTLWIQPVFGDLFSIPLSPDKNSWRQIYHYLKDHHYPEIRVDQIRLFLDGENDLSRVKEGDILQIVIADRMVERWVSEYTDEKTWTTHGVRFHHSTITWYDGRWGDPYEDPTVSYRTSLTLTLIEREIRDKEGRITMDYMVNPDYFRDRYGSILQGVEKKEVWYPTLQEACMAFRQEKNEKEKADVFTEKTLEHVIRLWELYHGTNQHLIDQGRYYDY
jgi:hypothetical protein